MPLLQGKVPPGRWARVHISSQRPREQAAASVQASQGCPQPDDQQARSSNCSFRNKGAREIEMSLRVTSGSYYQSILWKNQSHHYQGRLQKIFHIFLDFSHTDYKQEVSSDLMLVPKLLPGETMASSKWGTVLQREVSEELRGFCVLFTLVRRCERNTWKSDKRKCIKV